MPDKDWVKELTGVIQDLAVSVNAVKDATEKNMAAMEAYRLAAEKGFPIPPGRAGQASEEESFEGYDLAVQGKRLMDKFTHPWHQISEEKRIEMAKFFCLFLKAGVFQDWRARDKFYALYGRAEQKGSIVDIGDPGNVFPLPDPLMTEILAFAREVSVVLQFSRMWNMTSDKQSFPIEMGGASVSWGNETEEGGPTIDEIELSAEELSSYAAVKNATLADSQSDIVSWIAETMAEAIGLELDNQAFNGTGLISPFCYGILSSQCGNSVTFGAGETAFSDIEFAYLSEAIAKLAGKKKNGARWFMSGEVFHYVRTLRDDVNRPVFIENLQSGDPGKILGYPWHEVINMPTTSAAATAFIAFGNLRYFMIGRRLANSALIVNPYAEWKKNRTLFKIYNRWGLRMGLPNGFVRILTHA